MLLTLSLFVACVPVLTSPPGSEGEGGDWVAPENSWGMCEAPPASHVGEGYGEGEVAPDFRLHDQHGAEVSLWQFHGCPVLVDISTMWCAPCQELAEDAQAIADDYADIGLVYLTIMPQDLGSDPPDQDELNQWGDAFAIAEPILSDDVGVSYEVVTGSRGFPAALLIDEDGVVVDDIAQVDDAGIRAAIDDAF